MPSRIEQLFLFAVMLGLFLITRNLTECSLTEIERAAPGIRSALKEFEFSPIANRFHRLSPSYIPSPVENYITKNSVSLGLNELIGDGCAIWTNRSLTPPDVYAGLESYAKDIRNYTSFVNDFEPIPDLLEAIKRSGNHDVCATARPHPDGIEALFPSMQLSLTKSGYVEPLLPPMRDQRICENFKDYLMNMDYLVHDFEAMCHALKPTSKRVLIDMGASLDFRHNNNKQPIMHILNQFEKFGFFFDHIYAFEMKQQNPIQVFDKIPEKYMHNYHWVNVGVSAEEGNKLNPLHSILKKFDEDDFILVKLDIDTSSIEIPLAKELLEDKDGVYHKLVDQFYFEHHVGLEQLVKHWGPPARNGLQTIKDSLDLFLALREKGIPAHFWP